MKKVSGAIALVIAGALMFAACGGNDKKSAAQVAQAKAAHNKVYVTKNKVELGNYNKRQAIADDPTTILWCTAAFSTTGAPLVTVPIVGKLTSSGKRPYRNTFRDGTEKAGPDAMFGPSVEYRYGFTPDGTYIDFTGIQTICTTEPKVWQKEQTTILLGSDPGLKAASDAAQNALKNGDEAGASKILSQATGNK